jgi:hypothetical protein
MLWLIVTSYRRNRRKYLSAILSLVLTTFLATVSIGGLTLASAMFRRPVLDNGGGHILMWASEPEGTWSLFYPKRVFEKDRVVEIAKAVFPEASVTSMLVVPATYPDEADRVSGLSRRHIVGRSDNLDTWYLFPRTASGLSLMSVPADEPSVVVSASPHDGPLTEARVQIARYVGTDYPWEIKDADVRTLEVVGTVQANVHRAYMRLEALQAITGCPPNMVSMIGIALPGMQDRIDVRKVEELKTMLREAELDLEVYTIDDVARGFMSGVEFLEDGPRRYLPIIYGMSFAVVTAIVASLAHSRRRELYMLHVVGMNRIQVRTLFATEFTIAAALAGVVGYLPILLVARLALKAGSISIAPIIITLVGSVLIAAAGSMFLAHERGWSSWVSS